MNETNAPAPIEIERRFLIGEPLPAMPSGRFIEQAYLATGTPQVRVRRSGDRCEQTVKGERIGLRRPEVNFDLEPDVGAQMIALAGSRVLKKTRYQLGVWELDIYHGDLAGLIVMEIELDSEDAPLPDFPEGVRVIREVSEDRSLDNATLADLTSEERQALVRSLYPPVAESRRR